MASFMRPAVPTFTAPLSVPSVPNTASGVAPRLPPHEQAEHQAYAPQVPLPEGMIMSHHDTSRLFDELAIMQAKLDRISDSMTAGAQGKRNAKVKEIGDAPASKPRIHLWLRGVITNDPVVFRAFLHGGNKLCPQGGFKDLAEAATCGSKGAIKKVIPDEIRGDEEKYRAQFGAYVYSVWSKLFAEEHQKVVREFRSIYDDPAKGPAAAYAAFSLA